MEKEFIPQYQKDWNLIKSISWDKYPDRQIYIDEKDHFVSMRRANGSIAICGYLNCPGSDFRASKFTHDFYLELEEFGSKYNEPYDVSLVTSFSVVELDYLYLEKFPKDFRFYVIRNRGLELQNLANCIKYSRVNHRDLVALRDPNTKWEVTQRKNNNFDSEDNIMRALEGGYGDEFGF